MNVHTCMWPRGHIHIYSCTLVYACMHVYLCPPCTHNISFCVFQYMYFDGLIM